MADTDRAGRQPGRRAPDPLALVCGLAALLFAGAGFAGVAPGEIVDLRWMLALAAVLAGVSFIVMSVRNSRATSDE